MSSLRIITRRYLGALLFYRLTSYVITIIGGINEKGGVNLDQFQGSSGACHLRTFKTQEQPDTLLTLTPALLSL